MSAVACATDEATAVFETDWLASRPVFYNEKTARVSHNVNDVIDFENLEFHPEGFNNYLKFGYAVFQQTPVRDVRFLPPAARLTVQPGGRLRIERLEDPVEHWWGRQTDERDVLAALEARVRAWEDEVDGEIVIPTSGGFDSRLLCLFIKDKRRILSFSYGLSPRQEESYEVVYARQLAERLGTRWRQIPLGNYHLHFDEWDALFGLASHAHGMYHLEFYRSIARQHEPPLPLLSGIIGDAWAGAVSIGPIESVDDVLWLGYPHGMHADGAMSVLRGDAALAAAYFERNRNRLTDERFRVVESMRCKIVLLSYLMRVPEHIGYRPWSPFLLPEIALGMLLLPAERRTQRRWQHEFFKKCGLHFESAGLEVNRENNLNQQALRRMPVRPLDVGLLREVLRPEYVRWINRTVAQQGARWDLFWKLVRNRRWGRPLRRRGVRERRLEAYFAYLTLKPVENALKRRDRERRGLPWEC